MTVTASPPRLPESDARRSAALLVVLGAGICLRMAVAGAAGASSVQAAWVFVAVLLAAAAACWTPAALRSARAAAGRWVLIGVIGAVALVAGPLLAQGLHTGRPHAGSPIGWGLTVVAVSVAEELVLRGVLFAQLARLGGDGSAVALTSVVFALMHVPLYGWRAVPLDLAVGAWLGGLRLWSGHAGAPATAHALADLCSWWL